MNELAVERFFVVAVELASGKQSVVRVRGETPAEAYKAARGEPEVRRVGKVTEVDEEVFHADHLPASLESPRVTVRESRSPSASGRDRRPGQDVESATSFSPSVRRESLIGFTISGPRVVLDSRKTAVEQPFKNLKAPPGSVDRGETQAAPKQFYSPFNPTVQPKPLGPPIFAKPAATPEVSDSSADTLADEAAAAEDGESAVQEYRIVKSRRREGSPYLLQRGLWRDQKGKRTFVVDWEKGFDEREKAEKHQSWLVQAALEAAELAAAN